MSDHKAFVFYFQMLNNYRTSMYDIKDAILTGQTLKGKLPRSFLALNNSAASDFQNRWKFVDDVNLVHVCQVALDVSVSDLVSIYVESDASNV